MLDFAPNCKVCAAIVFRYLPPTAGEAAIYSTSLQSNTYIRSADRWFQARFAIVIFIACHNWLVLQKSVYPIQPG
jgi:hypothetical protein